MGANYDMLVIAGCAEGEVVEWVREVIGGWGARVTRVGRVGEVESRGGREVVVGPVMGGKRIVAGEMGCEVGRWVSENPLGGGLSKRCGGCVHLWTYDSGGVAGYTVYVGGGVRARDCRWVQALSAAGVGARLGGVTGDVLKKDGETLWGVREKFSSIDDSALEQGMASVAAGLGLGVHLVDMTGVVDEGEAVAVEAGEYVLKDLSGWRVVEFEEGKGGESG